MAEVVTPHEDMAWEGGGIGGGGGPTNGEGGSTSGGIRGDGSGVEDGGGGGGADDNEESRAEAIPLEREHHSTFYLLGCYSHTRNKN
jgi:hypothetical protein